MLLHFVASKSRVQFSKISSSGIHDFAQYLKVITLLLTNQGHSYSNNLVTLVFKRSYRCLKHSMVVVQIKLTPLMHRSTSSGSSDRPLQPPNKPDVHARPHNNSPGWNDTLCDDSTSPKTIEIPPHCGNGSKPRNNFKPQKVTPHDIRR